MLIKLIKILNIPNFNYFWTQTSTRFQLMRDSFHHFDWKNVLKDNAVKKSVCMGTITYDY